MSEENKMIYCTQCGSENPAGFKFCSNCGTKLEQPVESPAQPVYEKVEAEILENSASYEAPKQETFAGETVVEATVVEESVIEETPAGEELNIQYEAEDTTAAVYKTPEPQYYSSNEVPNGKVTNGNIGFSITSLVCGIFSILCCCFVWFSVILGIVAVVFGVIALKNNYDGKGMAIAGLITGGLGILICLLCWIVGSATGALSAFMEGLTDY